MRRAELTLVPLWLIDFSASVAGAVRALPTGTRDMDARELILEACHEALDIVPLEARPTWADDAREASHALDAMLELVLPWAFPEGLTYQLATPSGGDLVQEPQPVEELAGLTTPSSPQPVDELARVLRPSSGRIIPLERPKPDGAA